MRAYVKDWQPKERKYRMRPQHDNNAVIEPDVLRNYPVMASLISRCIAAHSRSQINRMLVLSEFIDGNRTLAYKLMEKINNDNLNHIIDTLATEKRKEELAAFRHANKQIYALNKYRNQMAHGLFAAIPGKQDEIVVYDRLIFLQGIHEIADPRIEKKMTGMKLTKKYLEEFNNHLEKLNEFIWSIYIHLRRDLILPGGAPNPDIAPGR